MVGKIVRPSESELEEIENYFDPAGMEKSNHEKNNANEEVPVPPNFMDKFQKFLKSQRAALIISLIKIGASVISLLTTTNYWKWCGGFGGKYEEDQHCGISKTDLQSSNYGSNGCFTNANCGHHGTVRGPENPYYEEYGLKACYASADPACICSFWVNLYMPYLAIHVIHVILNYFVVRKFSVDPFQELFLSLEVYDFKAVWSHMFSVPLMIVNTSELASILYLWIISMSEVVIECANVSPSPWRFALPTINSFLELMKVTCVIAVAHYQSSNYFSAVGTLFRLDLVLLYIFIIVFSGGAGAVLLPYTVYMFFCSKKYQRVPQEEGTEMPNRKAKGAVAQSHPTEVEL
jgi:hypothetical protein